RQGDPGYDALVQAEAGWAALTGEPGGPPVKSGLSLADYATGLMAALALMIALFDAQRTGRGRDVDTSLYDVARRSPLRLIHGPARAPSDACLHTQPTVRATHDRIVDAAAARPRSMRTGAFSKRCAGGGRADRASHARLLSAPCLRPGPRDRHAVHPGQLPARVSRRPQAERRSAGHPRRPWL